MQESSEQMLDNFCFMVVEEFLMRKKLQSSLRAFREEWERPAEDVTMFSWYEVALKLRLPDIIAKGSAEKSVLDNLVNALVQESSLRTRRSAEVTVSGLCSAQKTVSLPQLETSCFDFQTNTANKVFSPSPERVSRPRSGDHFKLTVPMSSSKNRPRRQRNKLSADTQAVIEKQMAVLQNEKFGKSKPSSENWVPEATRFRFLQREILVAKENLSGTLKCEDAQARNMKALKMTDVDRARVEKSLGTTKEIPCACCHFKFLYVNLPLKVSQKAIIDIRVKWSGGLNSASVFGKLPSNTEDDEADGDVTRLSNSSSHSSIASNENKLTSITRCYNEVLVCCFCAQFFHDQEEYRPSFQKIYYEERKATFLENRRREKEYWDPLKMCEKYREEEEAAAEAAKQAEQEREREAKAAQGDGTEGGGDT